MSLKREKSESDVTRELNALIVTSINKIRVIHTHKYSRKFGRLLKA